MNQAEVQKLIANVPEELKRLNQWVVWLYKERNGKQTKVPIDGERNRPARSNDPSTWTNFNTAIKLFGESTRYNGIGFMFRWPHIGTDIDHCIINSALSPFAKRILSLVNSYSEISPSGTGAHNISKGSLPRSFKNTEMGLEIYTGNRFFTVTGDRLEGYSNEIMDRTVELNDLYIQYGKTSSKQKNREKQTESNQINIEELLTIIRRSKSADKFELLFSGNWEAAGYSSQSEADLALCSQLAFWTGKNTTLMDAIFRMSKLFREKWDERHSGSGETYGQMTINKAIDSCEDTYDPENYGDSGAELTQGESITRLFEEEAKAFFNDQHGVAHVVLPFEDHNEVWPLDSSKVRFWVARKFRNKYGVPPMGEAINQALLQISAICDSSRPVKLFNRVGHAEGIFYYDLVCPEWKGVRIGQNGFSIVPLPTIFRRDTHLTPQAIPIDGGDPRAIFDFVNIRYEDRCLFITAVASFFIPDIPHPIIILTGEQGSGKSVITQKIKDLCDPSIAPLSFLPKDPDQLQMNLDKSMVSGFDNVSSLSSEQCDLLCRGITGEGSIKRRLYTNNDSFIRQYQRCVVLNGIGTLTARPDLLDRAIIFEIPCITDRRPTTIIESEWLRTRPSIVGGFFTAISRAMGTVDKIAGYEKFRMSDFARWGAALAEAFGFTANEFLSKYQNSITHKMDVSAEENFLVDRIRQLLIKSEGGCWIGTLTSLLELINSGGGHHKNLPNSPRGLSSELARIAPLLRNIGINIKRKEREGGTGRILYELSMIDES